MAKQKQDELEGLEILEFGDIAPSPYGKDDDEKQDDGEGDD